MEPNERLHAVASQVSEGHPAEVTVREILGWFGAHRRGYYIVQKIRQALREANLRTDPDFEAVYIDSPVQFVPSSQALTELAEAPPMPVNVAGPPSPGGPVGSAPIQYADPTYRISKLLAANRVPVSVPPDASVTEAVTKMLTNGYSQLPVMTNERDVKGVISWTTIGRRLALGRTGTFVRELMDQHQEIRADASLFSAIESIAEHQYVLIRGQDQRITGIVTSADLSFQFKQLAEPFLLLGEIENHIRRIISDRFSTEQLAAAKDEADASRTITSAADLTFGEYARLLENPGRWAQLHIQVDRDAFLKKLKEVREIRNDVMHFDPDGIPEENLETLRTFAAFFRHLQTMGAT